jgi:preprotein translocase subunit YajC
MIQLIAQAADQGQQASPFGALLFPVILVALMYLLMIRPQQRKVKQQRAMIQSLEVGDDVMTSGGILGRITEIDDEEDLLSVEIAPGTTIRMVRQGIARRLVEEDYGDEGPIEGADEQS